jgi:hypothetical protein
MYARAHTHTHTHTHTHIHSHMHTHMYIHTHAYTCTYAHMNIHIQAYMHRHMHSHEHTLLTFYMFTCFSFMMVHKKYIVRRKHILKFESRSFPRLSVCNTVQLTSWLLGRKKDSRLRSPYPYQGHSSKDH